MANYLDTARAQRAKSKADTAWDLDDKVIADHLPQFAEKTLKSCAPWYIPVEVPWNCRKGHFFAIERKLASQGPLEVQEEYLILRAFEKRFVHNLIAEASEFYRTLKGSTIEVCTPLTRKERSNRSYPWASPQSQPSRSPHSLDLNAQVREVFDDVEEFGKPQTCDTYQQLEKSYKRNLLFDGPPSTGKTSIVTAIAGRTGRSLYKINDANLADEDLSRLVTSITKYSPLG